MRVLMMTDMEGVAGVVSFEPQSYPDGKHHEAGKRLVTAEVNAAIDGLFEAGATDILVIDGHGPGAIVFEMLDERVRLIHGRPLPPTSRWADLWRDFDVCVMIGQHAMAGVADGNQNHTQASRAVDFYRLNGQPIGEIAQFALHQGALGCPMIFLSGDDAACREAEALIPGVTTASVKQGLGRNAAISRSAVEARRRIHQGAADALRRHQRSPVAPLTWAPPYELEIRYFHTDQADASAARAGAERIDSQTVRFTSDNVLDLIYR